MALNFIDILDKPEWRPLAVAPNNSAQGVGITGDLRNNDDRHPVLYQLASATVFNQYNAKNDGWSLVGSPALAGTFGAGAGLVFVPSQGIRGSIAAGSTNQSINTSTVQPVVIPQNRLCNRGGGRLYKIRVIDNGAGGTGKIEEVLIVANTESNTPTIVFATPLTFTPVVGSTFEVLSGRVYMLGAGTVASGIWKYYDVALNTFTTASNTNLPATIATNSNLVALDELYTPSNRAPSEGYFGNITASATGATSITATGLPSALLANQFRNFQVRIVEDTTTPTSVGQRRIISSHTSGASAVLTLSTAWAVTPSATAKFVIENSNEILLWVGGQTATYTYNHQAIGSATADTWSSTRYAARGTAIGVGAMSVQGFGVPCPFTDDPFFFYRHSQIFSFRGGGVTSLDILDIAGASNGLWTNGANYGSIGTAFTSGSCIAYDPVGNNGETAIINLNGTQNFLRFNLFNKDMNEWAQIRYAQGAAVAGSRMGCLHFADGADKVGVVHILRSSGNELFDCIMQR